MSANRASRTTVTSGIVEVRTPGRLHLGMISFGNPAVPSFGGVGVMVAGLGVGVRLTPASTLTASGPLADRAVAFARQCAEAWSLGQVGCAIEVTAAPPAHVGLGSGTQLALAVAAGMRQVFLVDAPSPAEKRFSTDETFHLAAAVGRGRRSCVGIYGFAGGGLIFEEGRFAGDPSKQVSPLVARVALPEAWRCVVFIHRDAEGLFGEAEKEAFARLPSVPEGISAELSRIAAQELMPAAERGAFDAFSDAVLRYGRLAGKPFEPESSRLPFHDALGGLIDLMGQCGIRGVAQSSWGPAVMACCDSPGSAERLVATLTGRGLASRYDMVVTRFDRQGAELTYKSP
jgi:beta-RFAP synthase